MTPPAAAAAVTAPRPRSRSRAGSRSRPASARRRPATASARRISGPLARPAAAAAGAGTIALPFGQRLARAAVGAPDHPLIARLVRGRAWIGLLAFMLIGIVFMQVTLLQMNAGIGRAVESSASLERANGELRVQVSKLSSGERIGAVAARFGMITPVGGQLSSARSKLSRDTNRALANLRAGSFGADAEPVPIVTTEAVPDAPATPTPTNLAVAPATTVPTAATGTTGATAAPQTQTAAAQAQAPAPAQTQTASAPPAQTQAAAPVQPTQTAPPPQAAAAPTPAGTPAGGVTAPR